jgi:uncharacterized membrane protein YphA (DoxX/SURF4 family)
MKRTAAINTIVFLFILLFVYASVSKFIDYGLFKAQLGKSPLITRYAGVLAWLVPVSELVIVLLLFIPRFVLIGLYMSFSIMFAFTAYIVFILNFSPYVPCSCGGILEKMGWTEHLFFNIGFLILGLIGIVLQNKNYAHNQITTTS